MVELKSYCPPVPAAPIYWSDIGIPAHGAELYQCVQQGLEYAVLPRMASISGFSVQTLAPSPGYRPTRFTEHVSVVGGRLCKATGSSEPHEYSMLRRLCLAATGGLLATGSSHLNGRSRTGGRSIAYSPRLNRA